MSDPTSPDAAGVATEATNPAAAQPNAATTQAQTDGAEGGEGSPVAEKTFTQKDVDDLIKRTKAATEAKTERRVLRTLERFAPQQQSAPRQEASASADQPPGRDKFATDEDWLNARDEWRDKQRESKAQAQRQEQREIEASRKAQKVVADASKIPGFDAEAFAEVPLTQHSLDVILESEKAPQLVAHLAANPDVAERIAGMSPLKQAAELGRIEAKLATTAPRKTQAPDPISPIGGGKTPIHNLQSADHDAYRAQRKAQGARWAR